MGVFIQPPFWSQGAYSRDTLPHARSVLITPPTEEPISVPDAKKFARITVSDEDDLMVRYIASARSKVEQDTGLALLTQTRDVYLDVVNARTIVLPAQTVPLQSVTSIKTTDTAGVVNTLDPSNYVVDLASGRIGLSLAGIWPMDVRPFQPWVLRVVSGWTSADLIPAPLVHAVGLLAGHYANAGRDRFTAAQLYDEFEEKIAPYRLVTVA